MTALSSLGGVHHVSAVSAHIERTHDFYTRILGLRPGHGAGGVHHVALRVSRGQSIADWISRLDSFGYGNSGIVDRHYFTSVYVREPNGVLFELATDGPGFDVDGPLDGERLSLPPFLEPRRAEIEASLKPLTTSGTASAAARSNVETPWT